MKSDIFFPLLISLFLLISSSCNSGSGNLKVPALDSSSLVVSKKSKIPEADFKRYYDNIKDFYEKKLLRSGFNGAILVAKYGEVIFEDYHGYFDLKKKDTLTRHSAFHLASVSKTFTAMAILRLAEMGKLSVTDDVKKYFPGFPYDNVMVSSLLSHRSGLPNYIYFMEKLGWNTKEHCSDQDVLNYLVTYKPAGNGRANTHFNYCNTNYALLGLIIERASGQSYADFLQQQFFTPLEMNNTYVYDIKDSATAMPSYDYRGRQEAFTFLDCGVGDKNIYSTPEDLLKWDQALYPNHLFSDKTLEEAFTPYSNEKPGIRNYGYGWRMNVYPNGKKVIYHNGWWHGNNTVFIRMIQDSVTIIVLGNQFNKNIYEAKDLEGYFDSNVLLNGEDDAASSKEEINTNEHPDSILNKKIEFSKKEAPVKKANTKGKK